MIVDECILSNMQTSQNRKTEKGNHVYSGDFRYYVIQCCIRLRIVRKYVFCVDIKMVTTVVD